MRMTKKKIRQLQLVLVLMTNRRWTRCSRYCSAGADSGVAGPLAARVVVKFAALPRRSERGAVRTLESLFKV